MTAYFSLDMQSSNLEKIRENNLVFSSLSLKNWIHESLFS